MQQPDENGFVTVTWPSRSIPHGGIFHSKVAESSDHTQQFLKVLLEEAKLDIAQRSKSVWKLRQDEETSPEFSSAVRMPLVRPRTSRRRSLSAIRESGAFEVDSYQPLKRGEDREQLKERLANLMAFGDSQEQQKPPSPPRLLKPKTKLPTDKEKKNELLTQIRERVEWLAEMEYLGHAAPHREIIQDQIAKRMRALDALGLDSECSSARSTKSGFSTLRSKEHNQDKLSQHSKGSSAKSGVSGGSKKSQEKMKSLQSHTKGLGKKDEHVSLYNELHTPLQYSPRRRV